MRPYFLRSTVRLSRVRKPALLQHAAQLRLVVGERLGDAVTHRAGLTRETAAGDRHVDVVLRGAVGRVQRLLQQHLQNGAREVRL